MKSRESPLALVVTGTTFRHDEIQTCNSLYLYLIKKSRVGRADISGTTRITFMVEVSMKRP